MRPTHRLALVLSLAMLGLLDRAARAEDPPKPPAPPAAAPGEVVETLPERVIAPPRQALGPSAPGEERTLMPLREETATVAVPYATSVLDDSELRERRNVRSFPDALLRLPSTVVQKTGPGQASPFLRGFTGYNNLVLIDGVRLNNSTFRSGPNQYWSTVDAYTVGRLEVGRGPHSVLWGSDAVGGTVYVVPRQRTCFAPGTHLGGGLSVRHATGEQATFVRGELEGNVGRLGWLGGLSWKDYGNIESGGGTLPNTAYDELDGDLRLDWQVGAGRTLTLAWQHVDQDDVPRTHTTIYSVPFAGTSVGTDLRRDLDQQRDLAYLRYAWRDTGGPFPSGHALVSWQQQDEQQVRERTGNKLDISGFTVDTLGAAVQLDRPMRGGTLTVGADAWRDQVDSSKDNYLAGAYQSSDIQGPLGDDAQYDLASAFAQAHLVLGCWEAWAGLRFTYAAASADRVDNPLVAGSNPATAGNVIAVDGDWTALVASLRALWHASRSWNFYGGISQAFRAPSLSDLTAFESTSVVEVPAPSLDPDRYVVLELGTKLERRNVSGSASVWTTRLQDTIVRSPTGALIGGVPEVRKDNVGDGWLWGFELEAAWRFARAWSVLGNLWWMDGEVDQFDASQQEVRGNFDRLPPLTSLLALRSEPAGGRLWAQAEWVRAGKADRLSLQNQSDTQRIPPGGTPGYDLLHLRAGYRLTRSSDLLLAVENITDEDYRIHGSGQNEPGRNVVLGLDLRF
ncbi:MAG: TonB-dependent receptor [Planctomycetia bacterium]